MGPSHVRLVKSNRRRVAVARLLDEDRVSRHPQMVSGKLAKRLDADVVRVSPAHALG